MSFMSKTLKSYEIIIAIHTDRKYLKLFVSKLLKKVVIAFVKSQ
eukprot:UN02328